jgi:hypothetical protein
MPKDNGASNGRGIGRALMDNVLTVLNWDLPIFRTKDKGL